MAASLRWASCRILRAPGGIYLRESSGMMVWPLKVVLSQRWKMLFATQACEMRQRRMMARSPCGPPKLQRTTLFPPQTVRMIVEVIASCPKKKDCKAGKDTCKHFPVCGLIEGKNSGEIGEGDEVFKMHVDKGAFNPIGSMILVWL
jgi:hypothetical protein